MSWRSDTLSYTKWGTPRREMRLRDERRVVARGDPLDGKVLGAADPNSYEVCMADRSVWTYIVTTDLEVLPDGSTPVVFVARRRRPADARNAAV